MYFCRPYVLDNAFYEFLGDVSFSLYLLIITLHVFEVIFSISKTKSQEVETINWHNALHNLAFPCLQTDNHKKSYNPKALYLCMVCNFSNTATGLQILQDRSSDGIYYADVNW